MTERQRQAASRLFCFGLGYTGAALAGALRSEGWKVAGTCRSPAKRALQIDAGIEAHLFDRDRPLDAAPAVLEEASHLLSSVPPDAHGDPVIDLHFFDLARLENLAWVGYLSSTAVYGDREGAWVDETSKPRPTGEAGKRRLEAEKRWLDLWHGFGVPVHIFRLSGIYGPGRNVLDRLREGRAQRIRKPGQVFGRIHLDDIVSSLKGSIARPNAGAIYNLSDDLPAPPDEVVLYASTLLGLPPPPETPFDEAELSAQARDFYGENKRVANRRIKEELGIQLRYPDYRSGLESLLDETARPLPS
ncbi:MAG: SDR family oxidoreductase [Proteobacteria bacterium]|nr:SDR family oxidoreductase [Pseudomonadota bacterium]